MKQNNNHNALKETIKAFDLEEKFAEALISFYYKKVRKELSEINTQRVYVKGLGYFTLKFWKVKYVLRRTVNYLEYYKKKTGERAAAIQINLERKLIILKRAQDLSAELINKKIEKKNERAEVVKKISESTQEPT